MSDNLELRKQALEATGWTFTEPCPDGFTYHRPNCPCTGTEDTTPCACTFEACDHAVEDDCLDGCGGTNGPAIESEPQFSEPWFLEWCEKNNYGWCIYLAATGVINCSLIDLIRGAIKPLAIDVTGATPSEARAIAVIAAAKKGQP